MVVPDALSRLSTKLHSKSRLKEEKQAFVGMVLLGLNEEELIHL
jgi:hypothetical protein